MIFGIKMEDFQRKDRFVARGHVTEPPGTTTYAILVSRETFVIDLTLADLNDLPVNVAYIHNSYIAASITEKIWMVLGREFGEDAGRKAILLCSLYGLKSSVSAFQNHL